MNIKIVAVGKIKEDYVKCATEEYIKRLSPYFNVTVIEIPAEQIHDESLCEKYKSTEGEKILKHISKNSYVITLEIKGKQLSSEDFAQKIKDISNSGINEIIFIIGGANGLAKIISDKSDFKLGISKMTFTHQLMRIILAEQIYRASKINAHEPYHR